MVMGPRILCIETSTRLCSVALASGPDVIAQRESEDAPVASGGRHTHAEKLNVFIDEVMREAGLELGSLNAVAVGVGPGSYTGLRIGLSAAKGLCYPLHIPIIGIGTLATLERGLRATGFERRDVHRSHPMIDARRMEVFTGDPPVPLVLDDAWATSLDATSIHVVFGDGADKAIEFWRLHAGILHVQGIKPWARAMAPIALERFNSRSFDDIAYLVPVYGKGANVTQAKG